MGRRSLPPGFRFHPTHVELVMFYLKRKIMRKKLPTGVISELDIYKYAPWDLPDKSCLRSGDLKWYFFCPRERKYASGARMNRATEFGYWKSTGKDRPVLYNDQDVGKIKTLTFFRGKAPKGIQTDWVMHEYRIEENNLSLRNVAQDAYVLCVIFQKDGPGPRNGAQYGAPFKEEKWDDDGEEEVEASEVGPSVLSLPLPSKEPQNSFAPDTSATPSNIFDPSSVSCISKNFASTSEEIPPIASGSIAPMEIPPLLLDYGEDVFTMQDIFPEDRNLNLDGGDGFQDNKQATAAASNKTDQNDIFTDLELEDVFRLSELNGDGNAEVAGHELIYNSEQMFPNIKAMFSSGQAPFLELNDLEVPLHSTSEYEHMQMSNLNAAYSCSSANEQPHFPFISFGAANQHAPSCQYPSLHNSNDQICHPTDHGFPDAHMFASTSTQSPWQQENIHHNSNVGCNGYKAPWRHDHNSNS